jgi:hypothetical protein
MISYLSSLSDLEMFAAAASVSIGIPLGFYFLASVIFNRMSRP